MAMRANDPENNQTSISFESVTEYIVDQIIASGDDDHH